MKFKQVMGVIVAGAVVVLAGVIGYKFKSETTSFWDDFWGEESDWGIPPEEDYVATINIEGTIAATDESGYYFEGTYNHDYIMESIENCTDDDNCQGIMLFLNTPGGAVYQSDEVYLALMKYKEKTGNPVYAYMGEQCCSGGYYIAMAADYIAANRNTWTGSIGVYVSLYNYQELLEKVGVDVIYFTSGDNKTMGAATEDMTEEQKAIFQSLVDEPYEQFVDIVVKGRPNLTEDKIRELADGRVYTARQACDNGLIDNVMSYEDAKHYMLECMNKKLEFYDYGYYESDDLFSSLYYLTGDNETSANTNATMSEEEKVLNYIRNNGSGVAMYYAMPE